MQQHQQHHLTSERDGNRGGGATGVREMEMGKVSRGCDSQSRQICNVFGMQSAAT